MVFWMLGMQVIGYYKNKGAVAELHAEKSPKDVTAEVQKVLSS
jgi:adenylate kinase